MSEINAFRTIWTRELLKWSRKRTELVSTVLQPIIWLAIFGFGMQGSISGTLGIDYLAFLAPGVVCQTIMFSAFAGGVSILMDKEFGFLKEILVSPVKRKTILLGKIFGGASIAYLQGIIVIVLALLLGVRFSSLLGVIIALGVMFLLSLAFMGFGMAVALRVKEIESFQKLNRFTVMPMWFLSGALYPIERSPSWLQTIVYFNPLTYGVDAIRTALISVERIMFEVDIIILCAFVIAMLWIGIRLFNRSEESS